MKKVQYYYTDSRQSGLGIIEIALVLAVAIVAVYGVYSLYQNTLSGTKVQNEQQNALGLASAVKQMYGASNDYGTADITATLVSTRSAPAAMIVGTALHNAWGGTVTVTGASGSFTISEGGVPQKECIQLSQLQINPTAISVNGAAQTIPYTETAAAAACNSATANTIVWTTN